MTEVAIKPLVIANAAFSNNIIQGPLAGISSAPFRLLSWRYSKPAFSYTEMVSCKTLIHHRNISELSLVRKLPGEGPVGVQLSGTCPKEVAEAVKIVTNVGADLIDLNCGCPVKKIRRRGAGSAHLSQPTKLYQLIHAMKQNTSLPVSIKIRVDGASDDAFNQEIAKAVSDAGADFLIVHGRHWQDDYSVTCHYDQIHFFVDALNVPVIGNGDIACASSLMRMLQTGCAGVMVSRAGVGRPWLIGNMIAEIQGGEIYRPTSEEAGKVFIEHVRLLADFSGSEVLALLQARKFCKYYARNIPDRAAFCVAVNACDNVKDLEDIYYTFFRD
ncbi:MAG: tRNA-dihydrouridine synthase [Gammaproteobacteria bacterium]|nr:tRNA-dihydrouridine synthase [Gammaproteobacteria bacterium]